MFVNKSLQRSSVRSCIALFAVALPGAAYAQEAEVSIETETASAETATNGAGLFAANDVLKFGEGMTGAFELMPSGVGDGPLSGVTARAGVLVQARGIFSYFEDAGGDDELDFGYENSRVKPYLFGTIGDANGIGFLKGPIEYRVQGTFVPDGGDFVLEDAFAVLPIGETLAVRAGQFVNPISAEGTTFGGFNLAVDRSLAAATLGSFARVQGVTVLLRPTDGGNLRGEAGITDGSGSANSAFFSDDADLAVAGRGELLLGGDWAAIEDFTAVGTSQTTSVIGFGGEVLFRGDTTLVIATGDYRMETADGLTLYGAGFATFGQFEGDSTFNVAGVAQAGKMLDGGYEPFARVSALSLDDDLPQVADDFSLEITGGINVYLDEQNPHRAKLTVDVGFLPVGSPDQPQLDYSLSDDFQFIVRGQLQLLL